MSARITRIDIEGFRVIDKLSLELRPLNVLIGENGSGKSTVLEALELLRKAASSTGTQFFDALYGDHQVPQSTRTSPGRLGLGVWIERDDDHRFGYELVLECGRDRQLRVVGETLVHREPPAGDATRKTSRVLYRDRTEARLLLDGADQPRSIPIESQRLILSSWAPAHAHLREVVEILSAIEVFPAFAVGPAWAAFGDLAGPRGSTVVRPGQTLDRDAANLANVFLELRNAGAREWETTIELLRLGLGHEVEDVVLRPDPGGVRVGLSLRVRGVGELPATLLSDGQLSTLALVAASRVRPPRSPLVAFDEPDLHLHPALIARITGLAEDMSEARTVVLTTHSDRLLDALSDPAASVVLFERAEGFRTRIARPDPERLARWLERYQGLGAARADGYESVIFTESAAAEVAGGDSSP